MGSSSLTRDRLWPPALGVWNLNHWTPREVLKVIRSLLESLGKHQQECNSYLVHLQSCSVPVPPNLHISHTLQVPQSSTKLILIKIKNKTKLSLSNSLFFFSYPLASIFYALELSICLSLSSLLHLSLFSFANSTSKMGQKQNWSTLNLSFEVEGLRCSEKPRIRQNFL